MQLLQKGIKIQKYLFSILLIGLILSLERYYFGAIPFTSGYLLPIIFSLVYISLLFLYILVLFLITFQICRVLFKKKSLKNILPYVLKFTVGLTLSIGILVLNLYLLCFHKIEIHNQTNQLAKDITITTSFTSRVNDEISGLIIGEIKSKSSETWDLINLEDIPFITPNQKLTLGYKIGNQQKTETKQTSFLRTNFIINGKSNSNLDIDCNTELNYKEVNKKNTLITTVNLCDNLLKKYTIDIDRFDDSNGAYLIINTSKNYQIKKVERILYWYPSIWSKQDDKLTQYIRLNNLQLQTTENLKVLKPVDAEKEIMVFSTNNNVILYNDPKVNSYDLSYFRDIDKKMITTEIEYELNNDVDIYLNEKNKQFEKDRWLQYSKEYSKGVFLDESNNNFDINIFDIYLKITFEGESGDYVRALHQDIIIGN